MVFSAKGSLLASALGLLGVCQAALSLSVNDQNSIKSVASTILVPTLQTFNAQQSELQAYSSTNPTIYWWEYGALWAAVLDYMAYFGTQSFDYVASDGTTKYVANVTQALISNLGPNNDFMPPNQTKTLGNDDQDFWTDVAMSAYEAGLSAANGYPSWLQIVETVFNEQAARWDSATCGGGLRWQIFTFNAGYDYKNSLTNGLFFDIAARLAKASTNKNATYSDWANRVFSWSETSGLLSQGDNMTSVYDGSETTTNCTQVNHIQWSANLGVYIHGCANMYAVSQDQIWLSRTQSLLNAAMRYFVQEQAPQTLYESACEIAEHCDADQLAYKGLLARWLGKTAVLVPQLSAQITPILQASASGAAQNCENNGTCGTHWYTPSYDGNTGPSQQLAALDAVLALAAGKAKSLGGTGNSTTQGSTINGTVTNSSAGSGNTSSTTTNAASPLAASSGWMSIFMLSLVLAFWVL